MTAATPPLLETDREQVVVWHPAHGGAGATTLRLALGLGVEVRDRAVLNQEPHRITVVIARTHALGLIRAQELAYRYAGNATLGGLALVADAPGKLPKPLQELTRLVTGGYPMVWKIPWVEAWRMGDAPDASNTPRVLARMASDLTKRCEAIDLRAAGRKNEINT